MLVIALLALGMSLLGVVGIQVYLNTNIVSSTERLDSWWVLSKSVELLGYFRTHD